MVSSPAKVRCASRSPTRKNSPVGTAAASRPPFSTFAGGRADHGTNIYSNTTGTDRYKDVVNDRFAANIQKKWYNFDTHVKIASLERMNMVHTHRIMKAKAKVDSSCPRSLEILEEDGRIHSLSPQMEEKQEQLRRYRAKQRQQWQRQHSEWLAEHYTKMNASRSTVRPTSAFSQPVAVQDYVRNSIKELEMAQQEGREGRALYNTLYDSENEEELEEDLELEMLAEHMAKHRGAVAVRPVSASRDTEITKQPASFDNRYHDHDPYGARSVAHPSSSGTGKSEGGQRSRPATAGLYGRETKKTLPSGISMPESKSLSPAHDIYSHRRNVGGSLQTVRAMTASAEGKVQQKRHGHLPLEMRRELFRSRLRDGSAPPSLRGPREAEVEMLRQWEEEQMRANPSPSQLYIEELREERRVQRGSSRTPKPVNNSTFSVKGPNVREGPSPHHHHELNGKNGDVLLSVSPYRYFHEQHPSILSERPEQVDTSRTPMSPFWRNKLIDPINASRGGKSSAAIPPVRNTLCFDTSCEGVNDNEESNLRRTVEANENGRAAKIQGIESGGKRSSQELGRSQAEGNGKTHTPGATNPPPALTLATCGSSDTPPRSARSVVRKPSGMSVNSLGITTTNGAQPSAVSASIVGVGPSGGISRSNSNAPTPSARPPIEDGATVFSFSPSQRPKHDNNSPLANYGWSWA